MYPESWFTGNNLVVPWLVIAPNHESGTLLFMLQKDLLSETVNVNVHADLIVTPRSLPVSTLHCCCWAIGGQEASSKKCGGFLHPTQKHNSFEPRL